MLRSRTDRTLTLCRDERLPEISRSLVVLVNDEPPLGCGTFGYVSLGRLYDADATDPEQSIDAVDVAVKTVPGVLPKIQDFIWLNQSLSTVHG